MTPPRKTKSSLAAKPSPEKAFAQRGAQELRAAQRHRAAGRDAQGDIAKPRPSTDRSHKQVESWGTAGAREETVYAPADRDRYATSPRKSASTRKTTRRVGRA